MARQNHLEYGGRKHALLRDLAEGIKTQRQLAAKYGVTQPAISQFIDRHEDEIEEFRANLNDELSLLWVTNKANRLAEYERDLQQLQGFIDDLEPKVNEDGTVEQADNALVRAQLGNLVRAKQAGLRAIADELGQIPNKITVGVDPGKVKYTVEASNDEMEGLD